MPIRFTDYKSLRTANTTLNYGATTGTLTGWFRVNGSGIVQDRELVLWGHPIEQSIYAELTKTFNARFRMGSIASQSGVNSSNNATIVLSPDEDYFYSISFASGIHRYYVNANLVIQRNIVGGLGQVGVTSKPISIGLDSDLVVTSGVDVTLGEQTLWLDRALSQAEIKSLRDRVTTPFDYSPAQIAWYMSLDGPPGSAVVIGDSGITDRGYAGVNMATHFGAGLSVYQSGQLTYAPPARLRNAVLSPERDSIIVEIENLQGQDTFIKTLVSPLYYRKGGGAPQDLGLPMWGANQGRTTSTLPYMNWASYPLEETIPLGTQVYLSGTRGFYDTSVGEIEGFDSYAVDCKERSTLLPQMTAERKAMKAGHNVRPTESNQSVYPFKDLMKCTSNWGSIVTHDSRGFPISSPNTTINTYFRSPQDDVWDGRAQFDHPPSGVFTLKWGSSGGCLLDVTMSSNDGPGSTLTKIFENITGINKTRQYRIDFKQNQKNSTLLNLTASNKISGIFDFQYINVFPPGEDGSDLSNPFSSHFLRMTSGAKIFRFMEGFRTNSGSNVDLTDFSGTGDLSYNSEKYRTGGLLAAIGPGDAIDSGYYANRNIPFRIVFQAPHNIKHGQIIRTNSIGGPNGNARFPLLDGGEAAALSNSNDSICRVVDDYTITINTGRYDYQTGDPPNGAVSGWYYPGAGLASGANVYMSLRRGLPIEYCIDLCNYHKADLWLNVPHAATDECVSGMINLAINRLHASGELHVEYTNEIWNVGLAFLQGGYAESMGTTIPMIQAVTRTSAGSGYTSQPDVVISSMTGSGATASAVLSGGTVAAINIGSGGYGYLDATASIVGGGGVGASGTPLIGLSMLRYFAYRTNQIHEIGERLWTNAGRNPSKYWRTYGAQASFSGGETATCTTFCKNNGYALEEICTGPYFNNLNGNLTVGLVKETGLADVVEKLTLSQRMDISEMYIWKSGYEALWTLHRPFLDSNGFSGAKISLYEWGPQDGVPTFRTIANLTTTIVGGGGSGAVVVPYALADGRWGEVGEFDITASGAGYTSQPWFIAKGGLNPQGFAAAGASGYATIEGGRLKDAFVVSAGSGYYDERRLAHRSRQWARHRRMYNIMMYYYGLAESLGTYASCDYLVAYHIASSSAIDEGANWGSHYSYNMADTFGDGTDGYFDNSVEQYEDRRNLGSIKAKVMKDWFELSLE